MSLRDIIILDPDNKKSMSLLAMKQPTSMKHSPDVYNGSHSKVFKPGLIGLDKVCTYVHMYKI